MQLRAPTQAISFTSPNDMTIPLRPTMPTATATQQQPPPAAGSAINSGPGETALIDPYTSLRTAGRSVPAEVYSTFPNFYPIDKSTLHIKSL